MLQSLWQAGRRDGTRSAPAAAEPVRFEVLGREFLYEPNDMRLYAASVGAAEELLRCELPPVRKPQFPLHEVCPRMAVLVVTKACNLRCRYCFAGPGSEGAAMSAETARQALELLEDGRDFTVGFFGGEPLAAFGTVRETVAQAEALAAARGVRARFSITTNATLLTREAAEFLDEHEFGAIASLDGPEGLHDANRPLAGGGGSYALAREGLRRLAEFPRLAARTTLRATYDGAGERAELVARLAHLNEVARESGFGNVSVEPADLSEGCGGAGAARPVRQSEELYQEYLDAARWYVDESRAGRAPRFHHFDVRLRRLAGRRPAPSECGAGVGYFAAAPDGKLYACHRLGECAVGSLPHGIDAGAQAAWRDNRYYARRRCPECWLRNVCGGGCRLNSVHNCGDIREPDPLGCWLTETCVRAAAWILAELAEG